MGRRIWTAVGIFLAAVSMAASLASSARADGDPGSDVLVYQDLFAGSDAGLSVQQQLELGGLLKAAARDGFPVRVAIIASPFDLGAVTGLWHNPRTYARFLGLELSLAYKQRLLVVMPNGYGFNWPGHSPASAYRLLSKIRIGAGGAGLFAATEDAVRALAGASGVKLASTAPAGSAASPGGSAATQSQGATPSGRSTDTVVAVVVLALAAIGLGLVAVRRLGVRPSLRAWRTRFWTSRRRLAIPGGVLLIALTAAAVLVVRGGVLTPAQSQGEALNSNPVLDPGTPLTGAAPDFTLSDQFGEPVSLRSFRGKVVILAFNDSECTTLCPLTTTAMLDAKAMLGKAGSQVQLLGIDANPAAISLEDVWSYSELHGMLKAWHFLTGSLPQLRQVWKRYGIEAAVEQGEITHTPALFVIDPQGRKAKVYITQMSYAAIGQLGQVLAQEASSLLPGHPAVHSDLSYARVPPTPPTQRATLPRAGGGTVAIGPGKAARVFLFFATWDRETSGLAGQLEALNRYQAIATKRGLPRLTAVDEASVEPSVQTLTSFLGSLPGPLSYPVAIDRSGKVADGYEVLGVPWFVVTSASGQLLYYREVDTAGWPSTQDLVRYVEAALARAQSTTSNAAIRAELAGSPAPLAALHQQGGQLLGAYPALKARLRALRGYPVVLNAWASWCGPCREEFSLFAAASARYGRRVAFLGVDTGDSPADARTFLSEHPVSYPSYQMSTEQLASMAPDDLPSTFFIDPAGKVVHVNTGQYDSLGDLEADISSYAMP